ncbi:MAG: hypothetical protein H5T35_07550, partial [Methanothermobacter sp.]|nr:hypothetical protein [Methanothermobacter sp.]
MELIDIIRAKSNDQRNYLLKDHLKETVARIDDFHNFYQTNREKFSYKIGEKTFRALAMAAIIH